MTTQKLLIVSIVLFLISAAILVAPHNAHGENACDIAIDATDAMTFSVKNIDVPKTCKQFTVNLKHVGKLGKNVMGHNLVIAKAADQTAILEDGNKAGVVSDYLKIKDERVITATKIIGGGESSTAKFAVDKMNAGENYVFFCSFPGHAFMMKGAVKLI